MIAKNSNKQRLSQNAKKVPHYSLRKLNIGVASVLLGTTVFFGANSTVVKADNESTTNTNKSIVQTKTQNDLTKKTFTLTNGSSNSTTNIPDESNNTNKNSSEATALPVKEQQLAERVQPSTTDLSKKSAVKTTTNIPDESNNTNKNSSEATTLSVKKQQPSEKAQSLTTNLSKQPAVKTTAKMTADNSSAIVDIANAKAGDTYKLVFHVDPHSTFSYTPGPLTQSDVVQSNEKVSGDKLTYTYEGKFLKDATVNQPFLVNLNFRKDILNTPGEYENSVDFYFNDKLIDSAQFKTKVPRGTVYANWTSVDSNNNPIPEGVSSNKYHEANADYWLIPGNDHQYTYDLDVDDLPTYLDHNGLYLTIGVPNDFVLDNVTGVTNPGYYNQQNMTNSKDFAFSQDSSGVHINVRQCQGVDPTKFRFKLIGHYDVATPTRGGIKLTPNSGSTVVGNDGSGEVNSSFKGIIAPILGTSSLTDYSFGDLVTPSLNVNPDETFVKLPGGANVENAYWLDRSHSDKDWFDVNFQNATLIDAPSQHITIFLPQYYDLTSFGQSDTADGHQKVLNNIVYHYSDGSTSQTIDLSKHVASISGDLTLKSAKDALNSSFDGELIGHLDPNHTFAEGEQLTASIGKNGDIMYIPGTLTTIKYVETPVVTNDVADVYDGVIQTVVGTNNNAGYVVAHHSSWQAIDNPSAQFIVTVPKNTVVSDILINHTYWQDPVYSTTAEGQQQLTFNLQPNLKKEQLVDITTSPEVAFKSTSIYVPALKSEGGSAQIIVNNKVQDQENFTVNLISATADYLSTAAQGNQDHTPIADAQSNDKQTDQATLVYQFVNGNQDSNITGVTFFGNLPQQSDGKSQFDTNLTGPVSLVDYLTGAVITSGATCYYSTQYHDPQTLSLADLSDFLLASQVSDWSQIKSFKVVFSKPMAGGTVYEIEAPAKVNNQVHQINRSGFLSGVVFGEGIMPFRVVPAGTGSAKLTVNGTSKVHQKLHYVDSDGHEHYINLGDKYDIKLTDTVDKLTVSTTKDGKTTYNFPANVTDLMPKYYHWDEKTPTVQDDATATYPDNLPNHPAQLNAVAQYYFDGDSIVWNLIADKQEQITVDELVKYHYYGLNRQAAPDYTKSVPAIVYINPLTNAVDGVELQQDLPKVTSPAIDDYHPLYGEFGEVKDHTQIKPADFAIDALTLDLSNKVGHIRHDDYYINAAAQLIVVDPNTHLAKRVELTYDDGSGQIKFKDTDQSLQLPGYKMHIYYSQGMLLRNDDQDFGYDNLKNQQLLYPYSLQNSGTGGSMLEQGLGFDNSFTGYDTLTAALAGKDKGPVNGKYDDQLDITENDGNVLLEPSQSFFVFYTPVDEKTDEQFLITADNDPLANSTSDFLKHLAIPQTPAEAAKSDIYSNTGAAGSLIFADPNNPNNSELPLQTDPYSFNGINVTSSTYKQLAQWLIDHGYTTQDQLSGNPNLNNIVRPGYWIDRADYQFTNADGITNTYTVQMHPSSELKQFVSQPDARVLINNGGSTEFVNHIRDNGYGGYDYTDLNQNGSYLTYDAFKPVGNHHYVLDVYSTQAYEDNSPAVPVLLSLGIFNSTSSSTTQVYFDSTIHDSGTPDPHPQILNVHFEKYQPSSLFENDGMMDINYKDVSDLLPNKAGQYQYGGGYDSTGHFKSGDNYDSTRMSSFANDDAEVAKLVDPYTFNPNYQPNTTPSYTVGGTMTGTGAQIQFSHAGDPSGLNSGINYDHWNHYDISAVSQAVAKQGDYVIVQVDPQAADGDHTWDMLDPAGYAGPDDPTGDKTLASHIIGAGGDWSSMSNSYPQTYYVYLKRKQRINYQVIVENKDGSIIKTLVPVTLLGVGGSNEAVATTKANGAFSSDPATLGDKYQSVIAQLAAQGYQAVTKANGNLKVSDSLAGLNFDDDQTKDQLVTIYAIQSKFVNVHYVDVNDSAKTDHFLPTDGTDLLDHLQSIAGLAGTDYTNSLWDWQKAGYVLATAPSEIAAETTSGSFKLSDPTSRAYYIYLKHGTEAASRQSTVKETIHYVYAGGTTAAPDYTKNLTFKQTGITDTVTNQTKWDPVASQDFNAVDSPEITGYTADIRQVPKQTVNFGDPDITQVVTYTTAATPTPTPQMQTIIVNYIDDTTGQILKTVTKTGDSSADSHYSTARQIDDYKHQHYILVSDETSGADLWFDNDTSVDQVYNVHLKHDIKDVTASSLVHETIHYVYANGKQAANDHQATPLKFTRTGHKDLVTGHTTLGAWTPASQAFAEVVSPKIDGYIADKTVVEQMTVNGDSQDIEVTVCYRVDSAQPTNPTPSTTPVAPTNPTPSTTPVEPTSPTPSTTPVAPTNPTPSTTPVAPTNPTPSTTPVAPTNPTPSTTPVAPTNPAPSTTPVAPINPTPSTTPVEPTSPVNPMNPDQPIIPTSVVAQPTTFQPTMPAKSIKPTLVNNLTNHFTGLPNGSKRLPQTGVSNFEWSTGLGIAALISMLGLGMLSRRRKN